MTEAKVKNVKLDVKPSPSKKKPISKKEESIREIVNNYMRGYSLSINYN
jgi:hypothetical protein